MKTLIYSISIITLALAGLAQAQIRADIDKDIPLTDAIEQANARFSDVQPLTEAEVVAAVRAIKSKQEDIPDSVFKAIRGS